MLKLCYVWVDSSLRDSYLAGRLAANCGVDSDMMRAGRVYQLG